VAFVFVIPNQLRSLHSCSGNRLATGTPWIASPGNRSQVGEQRRDWFASEFGFDGLCQPVEDVAVPAATGLDHG
jgi:hypothetical protein